MDRWRPPWSWPPASACPWTTGSSSKGRTCSRYCPAFPSCSPTISHSAVSYGVMPCKATVHTKSSSTSVHLCKVCWWFTSSALQTEPMAEVLSLADLLHISCCSQVCRVSHGSNTDMLRGAFCHVVCHSADLMTAISFGVQINTITLPGCIVSFCRF